MIDPKKIIIIGSAHPLRGGGIASFNERLAREFATRGFQVSIYSFSLQYPSFLFPGTSQYSLEAAPKDLDIKSAINSINPLNWFAIGRRIRILKPDIVIVRYWIPLMGPALGTILRLIRKNNQTKIICIADNIIPHERRAGDTAFTKYFLKPVDAFITMSEKVFADLKHFVNKPAVVVPHPLYDNFGEIIPVEVAREKLGIGMNEKVILFFGFIRKYKGLDILLRAMKLLKDAGSNIKLLIAGEFYEDKEKYIQLINELGIKEHLILYTSFISDRDVKYYLCAADCVVQPYRNATQSGVTPLAIHFEKPTIVTNVGGLPDMVSNGSGLIAEPDPADLAQKILKYFELGENSFLPQLREVKKNLSWGRMVDEVLAMARN